MDLPKAAVKKFAGIAGMKMCLACTGRGTNLSCGTCSGTGKTSTDSKVAVGVSAGGSVASGKGALNVKANTVYKECALCKGKGRSPCAKCNGIGKV
jgi:DnaJ-class molecular chaperone